MTIDIEKRFFDTFGIKPKELIFRTMNCACGCHDCKNCDKYKNNFQKTYPQITDRILLELICICNNTYKNGYTNYFISTGKTVEEIKKEILKKCIFIQDDTKHRVQALFKEGQDEET